MPGLKKTFGENPKGEYGTDRGGDDYYEVSHPSGHTIRSYSIPGVGSDYFSIHDMRGSEFENGKRVNHEVDGFVRPNKEEGKVTHEEMEKHLGDWVSENHPELKSEGSKTAGMFWLPPKFEPGDRVINFRGESSTVHSVYDSGHPGKSNKMKVIKDGETEPNIGLHNEQVYDHHPDAPAEQIERSERRINDAKNAHDAIDSAFTSVDQAHGADARWLLDNNPTGPSKYSSKTSGRKGEKGTDPMGMTDFHGAPICIDCVNADPKTFNDPTRIIQRNQLDMYRTDALPEQVRKTKKDPEGTGIGRGPAICDYCCQSLENTWDDTMPHLDALHSESSHKNAGRNGVTCPKCQRWFDLDDAPQDWYSHDCESGDSKSTAAKTAIWGTPEGGSDIVQGLIYGVPAGLFALDQGMKRVVNPIMDHIDRKKDQKRKEQRLQEEEETNSQNSANQDPRKASFKSAGEQAPYDTNCDHCGQPGATRSLKMDHTGYPKVDWHCDDCKDKTEDQRFEDIMKNGAAKRRYLEEHFRVSSADDPTMAYHDTVEDGPYKGETWLYHPKCVHEAGKDEETGWADKIKSNNGMSFRNLRTSYPEGADCSHCGDAITWARPHKTVECGNEDSPEDCIAPEEHMNDDEDHSVASLPAQNTGGDRAPHMNYYGSDMDLEQTKKDIVRSNAINDKLNGTNERRKKDEQELGGQINEAFSSPADKKKLDFLQSNPTGPTHLSARQVFASIGIDYDLFESVRPEPTKQEQGHANRHGSYPDSFYDRHWDAYDAAMGPSQASPQYGHTGSINDEVLDLHLTIGSTSMKVIASTPTHEISQEVKLIPPGTERYGIGGPHECRYCDDGTLATHQLMTVIKDKRPTPIPFGAAVSFVETCKDHLDKARDKEHTSSIAWLAKQGSLKTQSVGKQVCQTCRHSDDAHNVSTEWYCNPGEGGCGGNGVLSASVNKPYSTDHEDGCENPGAVEYNEGNEYCQGGGGRECICEGFANTKPKWSVDDEPQSSADDTDDDVYANPDDDDDSGFFNNLRTKSSQGEWHPNPSHLAAILQWTNDSLAVTASYESLSHPDASSMNESVKDMTCYECGEDYDAPSSNGMINSDECPNCGSDATYEKGKKNPFDEPFVYGSRKTASYDSLFHPDAADHSSVVPMTCYECEEDYDAPAWDGVVGADECPNCGSDATYQKGKKNTFAEDAREDRMAQDPR
jgi:hypothetical protein